MDTHLSLINGRQRDEAVNRVVDHLETTFWPSVLSSTLEDLLISQMLKTVDEITSLVADHQVSLDEIVTDLEPLRAHKTECRINATDHGLSGKFPAIALVGL